MCPTEIVKFFREMITVDLFNGVGAETEIDKANMLNDYFSSQTLINDQNRQLPYLDIFTDKTLDSITISVQDVKDVLENLDRNKTHSPNHVSP